jgi:Flp pilus assembly protein TadG
MNVKRSPFRRAHRGTSVVELALAMTLLLYVVLGAVEYGYLFLRQQQITNAARQGARLAATPDATSTTVGSQIDTLMTAYGMPKGTYHYTTTLTPTNIQPGTGNTLTVQISINYAGKNNLAIVNSSLCPIPATLTAAVTMEKEGP